MKSIFYVLIFFISIGCTTVTKQVEHVSVAPLLKEIGPVRAIEIDGDRIWFGGLGKYGWVDKKTGESKQFNFEHESKPDFRSIAQTKSHVFLLNAGSPAWLLRIDKQSQKVDTVYTDSAKETFYDSMSFSDDRNGMAIGDPVNGKFLILETSDGGATWRQSGIAPVAEEGEGAFAASNSNIVLKSGLTGFVSGGNKSRFFRRSNGKWESFETPIVQGETMTGIFTADFLDDKNGIIAGGHYQKPGINRENKAITNDGGKTWELISDGDGFGYASGIRYAPDSDGKVLVSVGTSGMWRSTDGGKIWRKIHTESGFYTLRFIDKRTAVVAGRSDISIVSFK